MNIENKNEKQKKKLKRIKKNSFKPDDFLAGWIGGAAGVIASHLLDTVKVRMQTNNAYSSTTHCIQKTFKQEGIRGFYKGMSFPLASIAVYNAFVFGVYNNTTRQICGWRYNDVNHLPRYSDLCVAAMATGGLSVLVGSPIDLIKIQLQIQTESRIKNQNRFPVQNTAHNHMQPAMRQYTTGVTVTKYNGPIQCLRDIYKKRGIAGLYRGASCMVLRDIPGYVIYFLPYKFFCDRFANENGKTGALGYLFAGGLAGVLSWGLMHPIDTIKSRLQADSGDSSQRKYRGIIHCVRTSYEAYGLQVFFRGMGVNAIRGFPQSAALFLGYETAMKAFHRIRTT